MSIVVPLSVAKGKKPVEPVAAPPDPNYLLMAAAQMHSEGRLIQKDSSGKDTQSPAADQR